MVIYFFGRGGSFGICILPGNGGMTEFLLDLLPEVALNPVDCFKFIFSFKFGFCPIPGNSY